jgi:hypothetical protein
MIANREIFCDECMMDDINEDYSKALYYNAENEDFRCEKEHIEKPYQIFRHNSKKDLIDLIMCLLKE